MEAVATANLGLRFLLELAAGASVAYWGLETGPAGWRWALAAGAVLALFAVWGAFVAPKAAVKLPGPARFAVELGVWTAAAAALWATGQEALATAFWTVAVASGALNYAAARRGYTGTAPPT